MTNSFACLFLHPYNIYGAPTPACRTLLLAIYPVPCPKCTSVSELFTAPAPISSSQAKPLLYDFHPYHTFRTWLHCPCLQLSVKHSLHFVIALCNAVWPTNCFKRVCLTFQDNLQGISEQHKSKYLKWLDSPCTWHRLGTQKTLHHFLSTDSLVFPFLRSKT